MNKEILKSDLRTVQKAQWAIDACTSVLIEMSNSSCFDRGVPGWWNQRLECGLLMAASTAANSASKNLESMIDRLESMIDLPQKVNAFEKAQSEGLVSIAFSELESVLSSILAEKIGNPADEIISSLAEGLYERQLSHLKQPVAENPAP